MHHAIITTIAASLAIASGVLMGQQPPLLQAGALLRVTTTDCSTIYTRQSSELTTVCARRKGELISSTADSIVLRAEGSDSLLTFPPKAVARIEMSRGRHGHPWRGAGIGFGAGAVAGVFTALVGYRDYNCYMEDQDLTWLSATILGLGGGLLGAGIGALIGADVRADRWEEVSLDQLRLQPVAAPGGRCGLAASVRF